MSRSDERSNSRRQAVVALIGALARKHCLRCGVLVLVVVSATPSLVWGQGVLPDNGHAQINGNTVFAAWNFDAGRDIPDDFSTYPEFLPNLDGWDFRINLPYVRYKQLNAGSLAPASLVGVVEGPANVDTINAYGHRNNSVWVLQVDADGRVNYKTLPSSRNLRGSETRNVRSLTTGWRSIGTQSGPIPQPSFLPEAVASAVVGEGLGTARVFVVARASDGRLFVNSLLVEQEEPTAWLPAWSALPWLSSTPASLTRCFDGKLALAWVASETGRVNVALHTPSTGAWSRPVEVARRGRGGREESAAASPPQLLWDGTALHLLFVASPTHVLSHTSSTPAVALAFADLASVSPLLAVKNGQFHAMVFNERIHVAMRQDDGSNGASRVFYSKSTTGPGVPSQWSAPSETGIFTNGRPRIAGLQHQIYVVGTDAAVDPRETRIVYSSKDMLSRGNDLTGGVSSDRWTVASAELVEQGGQGYREIEVLTFNGDIYLTATALGDDVGGFTTWIVNLSRAVLKSLLTDKLGARLIWGEPGGGPNELPDQRLGLRPWAHFTTGDLLNTMWPRSGEIPLIGDFDGNGSDDIALFTQEEEAGIGLAPVYVSLFQNGFQPATVWHPYFSPRGEIPLVGDFNGDGRDDIATFVQEPQDGVGLAPVWVGLSDGGSFVGAGVWHPYFSPRGEVPMVGDFDGDGRDDIATFVQERQEGIGTAPVWIGLSDGESFVGAGVWHPFFSLRGELPRVADVNLDGKDDIITFLHGQGEPGLERVSFVALSTGSSFRRSQTLVSDFGGPETIPFIGHFTRQTLQSITGRSADARHRFPDLIAFHSNGVVNVSFALANHPLPSGAPWERYKWFTDKGLGAALFPEWIWEGDRSCLAADHRLALLGQAGSGGGDLTNVSVRFGSRQGHVLEEVGHSLFANCFRPNSDPFGLYAPIFVQHWGDGGVGASQIAEICDPDDGSDYYDCRGPTAEHIFLHHMIQYVMAPEVFRQRLRIEQNPTYRSQLAVSYAWLRDQWFNGLEFHTQPASGAELEQTALQCAPWYSFGEYPPGAPPGLLQFGCPPIEPSRR